MIVDACVELAFVVVASANISASVLPSLLKAIDSLRAWLDARAKV